MGGRWVLKQVRSRANGRSMVGMCVSTARFLDFSVYLEFFVINC